MNKTSRSKAAKLVGGWVEVKAFLLIVYSNQQKVDWWSGKDPFTRTNPGNEIVGHVTFI
jgi:hypothetical protein